jgi:glycosyltransferase involved in cell wall biosynthesis
MRTADPIDRRASRAWASCAPTVSVVIATHNRAGYLTELIDALEALESPVGGFEVVLVDDGSQDGTWRELVRITDRTTLPLLALRLIETGGPSVPRNTAVAASRGRVLALTDDDCLPEPGWLRGLTAAMAGGAGIAQGVTRPVDGPRAGAWDRTIAVQPLSGLWETCNLGISRTRFLEHGGFPVIAAISGRPRGFGEDVLLGAAVARAAGAAPAEAAVVRHRWLPSSYRDHVAGRRRLVGFPRLLRDVPELRSSCWHEVFLTRRTAATQAGLVGVATAVAGRRWLPALAAVPWLALAWRDARDRPGRPPAWRLGQVLVADAVAAASLTEGTVRHRRLLL